METSAGLLLLYKKFKFFVCTATEGLIYCTVINTATSAALNFHCLGGC
jgi:hypothetical protein